MQMPHASDWLEEFTGSLALTFNQIARAEGLGKAQEELAEYVRYHPDDQLARLVDATLFHSKNLSESFPGNF